MIEEYFEIETDDGHVIYGLLNRLSEQSSKKAIILAHGYPSGMYNQIFQTGKRFFPEHGYDVIRFAFFGGQEKARDIMDITLETQAADLQAILNHFDSLYDELYLVGHSYGGLTVAMVHPDNVKAVSFWDPTFAPSAGSWIESTEYIPELDVCFMGGAARQVTGKAAYDEAKAHDVETSRFYAAQISRPAQVILAESQPKKMDRSQMYHSIPDTVDKELLTIKGSTHNFFEGDTVFELLEKTYEFFEKQT